MPEPHVVILGAGPAGVGAAYQLRRTGKARVTVLEQRESVGGNAGSFEVAGQRVDYGSHRLHPACDPEILTDIRTLLKGELAERGRHGRIRLKGKWIRFPLRPADLLLRLDRSFAAGVARDILHRPRAEAGRSGESFASVMRAQLGKTICEEFYFPYARKIWGREPEELSPIQARRRVAANSIAKLLRKVLGQLPGVKPVGFRTFHYPFAGYGAISEAYAEAAAAGGAELLLGCRVEELRAPASPRDYWQVVARCEDRSVVLEADHVWSTIPLPVLARITHAPEPVLAAAADIQFRGMLLIYLTLPVERFTAYDAHYFPGPEVSMTRLSEPKNYAARGEPAGRTTLCAEVPCAPGDEWWALGDEALGTRVAAELEQVGIPLPVPVSQVTVRRLAQAYPIYLRGYEEPFRRLDEWAAEMPRLLTYGRQGLFAHDNTHHALAMAYAAADCLRNGEFDSGRWSGYRLEFESHVVED